MRHRTNHKGTPPNCAACKMEEEYDKNRKMERKALSVAKFRYAPQSNEARNPSKNISVRPLRGF